MVRLIRGEEFREIQPEGKLKLRYAVSNKGRLISFKEKFSDGNELKGSKQDGYRVKRYKYTNEEGKVVNKCVFYYKMISDAFLEKTSEDQVYTLHLDYVRDNDDLLNLKLATRQEMLDHGNRSPIKKQAILNLQEFNRTSGKGAKLDSTKVMLIKKMLINRKTRLKLIAKKFNISEMQLYRISTGENWGHVTI